MNATPPGYGLIGCGGFGRFCLGEYKKLENLRCIAVADVSHDLATLTAADHDMEVCASAEELFQRPDIDIVHLATPPFTHAELAQAALRAGKHVLCEKPLALTTEDAAIVTSLAAQRKLILAVNLIMRYNPLCEAIKRVIDSGLLGEPLYATLTNLAQDEVLPPAHWFWDRSKSGGIFIEHGVHFFDLFEWWFGPGRIISAHQIARPGTLIFDQVNCQVRYGDMTLGSFYHGFHQMLRRDRQDWLIAFELGVITLSEWVPTRLDADVTLAKSDFDALMQLLPDPRIQVTEQATGSARFATSRNQPRRADIHAVFTCHAGVPKMELYGSVVRALMVDQLAAIHSPEHQRRVSEANGLSSVAYAVEAQAMADAACRVTRSRLRDEGREIHLVASDTAGPALSEPGTD